MGTAIKVFEPRNGTPPISSSYRCKFHVFLDSFAISHCATFSTQMQWSSSIFIGIISSFVGRLEASMWTTARLSPLGLLILVQNEISQVEVGSCRQGRPQCWLKGSLGINIGTTYRCSTTTCKEHPTNQG